MINAKWKNVYQIKSQIHYSLVNDLRVLTRFAKRCFIICEKWQYKLKRCFIICGKWQYKLKRCFIICGKWQYKLKICFIICGKWQYKLKRCFIICGKWQCKLKSYFSEQIIILFEKVTIHTNRNIKRCYTGKYLDTQKIGTISENYSTWIPDCCQNLSLVSMRTGSGMSVSKTVTSKYHYDIVW